MISAHLTVTTIRFFILYLRLSNERPNNHQKMRKKLFALRFDRTFRVFKGWGRYEKQTFVFSQKRFFGGIVPHSPKIGLFSLKRGLRATPSIHVSCTKKCEVGRLFTDWKADSTRKVMHTCGTILFLFLLVVISRFAPLVDLVQGAELFAAHGGSADLRIRNRGRCGL